MVLTCVQEDRLRVLARLQGGRRLVEEAGDEVPERVGRRRALREVERAGAVSGAGRERVAHCRSAGLDRSVAPGGAGGVRQGHGAHVHEPTLCVTYGGLIFGTHFLV